MNDKDYIICPACHARRLDLVNYETLMVLRRDYGMFTLRCPNCSNKISVLKPIPHELYDEVDFAAIEMGAGMGRSEQA